MSLPQLHYTWAPPGPDGPGLRFTAVTPGVPVALLREAERLVAYEPPPGGRAGGSPQALSLSLLSDGSRLLAHSVRTGGDGAPGLFHAHAVHLPQRSGSGPVRGALPITSWGSPQWATRTPPDGPPPPLAAIPVPGRHDRAALAEFVAARGPWLAPFFADVRRLVEEPGAPRIVLVEPDSGAVARWVMLACSVLPHQRGQWLTFTTYTRRPLLAPQGLIGVLPGEAPGEGGYRIYEPTGGPAPVPPDDVWARTAARVWLAGRPELLAEVRRLPGHPYAPGPLSALATASGIPPSPPGRSATHPPTTPLPAAGQPASGMAWAADPTAEPTPGTGTPAAQPGLRAAPTAATGSVAEPERRPAPMLDPEQRTASAEPATGTPVPAPPPTGQPGLRPAHAAEPRLDAAPTPEPDLRPAPTPEPGGGTAPGLELRPATGPEPGAGATPAAEPEAKATPAPEPETGATPAPEPGAGVASAPELGAGATPVPGVGVVAAAGAELWPAPTAGLGGALDGPGREPDALAGLLRAAARQGVDTSAQLPEVARRMAFALFSDPGRAYGEGTRAALTELPVLRALVLDRLDALAAGEPAAGVRLFARTELRLGAAEALPHLRMCARAAAVAESAPDRVVALDALLRASGVSLYAEPLVLRTAMRLVWDGEPPEPGEAGLVLATTGAAVHRDAGTWELLAAAAVRAPADDPTAAHLATELLRHFAPELPPRLRATLALHTAPPGRLSARPGRHRQAEPEVPRPDVPDTRHDSGHQEPRTPAGDRLPALPRPTHGEPSPRHGRHRQSKPGTPEPDTADPRHAPGPHTPAPPQPPVTATDVPTAPGPGGPASDSAGIQHGPGPHPAAPGPGGASARQGRHGQAGTADTRHGPGPGTHAPAPSPGVPSAQPADPAAPGPGWGPDTDPVGGMLGEGYGVRVLFEGEDARLLAAYRRAARDDRVRERLLASPPYLADCFAVWSAHPQAGPLWQEARADLLEEVLRPVVRSLPPERLAEAERELARLGRSRAEEFRAWRRPGPGARLRGLLSRRAGR